MVIWTDNDIMKPPIGDEYNVIWELGDGGEPLVTTMDYDAREKRWVDTRGGGKGDTEPKVLYWSDLPNISASIRRKIKAKKLYGKEKH